MKKTTLLSIGAVMLAGLATLNAQVLQINSGWQLAGATENITNMGVFTSDCVGAMYTYKSDTTGYRMHKPQNGSSQIGSLLAGDGFWVYGLKNCTIDTANSATPPAMPSYTPTTSSTYTNTTGQSYQYGENSHDNDDENENENDDENDDAGYGHTYGTTTTASSGGDRALYDQHCAGCHSTRMIGSSAAQISYAIAVNKGGMGYLNSLSSAQIQAIAAAR